MDVYCRECERLTEVVLDHSVGVTFCSSCGFVLYSYSFNETFLECTSFPDKESNYKDPDPVEGPETLSNYKDSCSNSVELHLVSDFKTIADMSERLGLVATIKDRANKIYSKVEDQNLGRGRNHKAVLAACMYIACRQEDEPHTIREICSVFNGDTRKEIGRAVVYIVKKLKLELGEFVHMKIVHASDFMRRFCETLGMADRAVQAAKEAAKKAEEFDIRRTPLTIAAAVIYTVTQLSDDNITLEDISVMTGVAEATIRSCYREMYPHLAQIIPNWYAKAEDLKDLKSL